MPSFVELQSDRIVNVRLHASQTLALLFALNEQVYVSNVRPAILGHKKVYTSSVLC